MSVKFADLVRGDTRQWGIRFDVDITGATGKMTWRKSLTSADPGALQLTGVLEAADGNGDIFEIDFDLTKVQSAALSVNTLYYLDFEITRGTDVKTIRGQIKIVAGGG